jgi:hypothetical protein
MASNVRPYTQLIRLIRYVIAGAMGMLVGAAVLTSNLNERYRIGMSSRGTTQWTTNFGWPLVSCLQDISEPPWNERRVLSRSVSWSRVWGNAIVGLSLVVGTMWAILLATYRGLRPRFSLLTLLAGVTIASLLLTLLRYERNTDVYFVALVGSQEAIYYPVSLLPLWICISLFFGMACTLYVAGRLSMSAARQMVSVFNGHSAKVVT